MAVEDDGDDAIADDRDIAMLDDMLMSERENRLLLLLLCLDDVLLQDTDETVRVSRRGAVDRPGIEGGFSC